MKEIIKISMGVNIKKDGDLEVALEQGIREDIEDIITKKELKEVRDNLENICKIVAKAVKRDISEITDMDKDFLKKIDECKDFNELFELAFETFLKD